VPALQNEACQCIMEVVYKGISDKQRKLELLTQLRCGLPLIFSSVFLPTNADRCECCSLFDVLASLQMGSYDDKFASELFSVLLCGARC
jgi:hypothetical protein